jgi:hypothetical protein
MEQTTKPWYLSKTIWGVIITFAGMVSKNFFSFDIPDISYEIVEICGLVVAVIGRFQAQTKIG